MKFLTDFTYRNLHGFARFPGDSTALVTFVVIRRNAFVFHERSNAPMVRIFVMGHYKLHII